MSKNYSSALEDPWYGWSRDASRIPYGAVYSIGSPVPVYWAQPVSTRVRRRKYLVSPVAASQYKNEIPSITTIHQYEMRSFEGCTVQVRAGSGIYTYHTWTGLLGSMFAMIENVEGTKAHRGRENENGNLYILSTCFSPWIIYPVGYPMLGFMSNVSTFPVM